jgi:hypothetical protein
MDHLADVEQQIILQFLDTHTRLLCARVCHRLHTAASHPFSWLHSHPFQVTGWHAFASKLPRTLARLAPVRLQLRHLDDAHIPFAGMPAAVHTLCAADLPQRFHVALAGLLSTAPFRQLRRLAVPLSCADNLQPVLDSLPPLAHLERIDLSLPSEEDGCVPKDSLQSLSAYTSLRTLHLESRGNDVDKALALCRPPSLTSLRLDGCKMSANGGFRVLGLPHFGTQLQVLRFSDFVFSSRAWYHTQDTPPSPADYEFVLRALVHLRGVELENCFGVDTLLLHLHCAPALRRLRILRRAWEDPVINDSFAQPKAPALRTLLTEAPQLQVQLVMSEEQQRAYRLWSARAAVASDSDNADCGQEPATAAVAVAAATNPSPLSFLVNRPLQFHGLTELAAIERVAVGLECDPFLEG